ncbi:MAG: outer membrane protein assembly factor BamA [Gammaproteobacteria bacterium]|nr:outer membrane protein assembly factor BamA [Gammaproteobacteria bacterium]
MSVIDLFFVDRLAHLRRVSAAVLMGCFWFFASAPTWAVDAFVVEDIEVLGLQRISLGTTFNYLPVKVGEKFDDTKAGNVIRSLYKTGFFEDIQLSRKDNILVVNVEERPSIAKIKVFGNKDLQTDDLNSALKEVGLTEGRIFNRSLLDQMEQELQRQYFSLGKYGATVSTKLTDLERNRVDIVIDINEGDAAQIKQINIVGAKAFDEERLLDKFELSPPTMWSGISGSGKYSKQELQGDLETLKSYYLDRGYIRFNIDSAQVSITPDKRDVYIGINVTEGKKYTVSGVKLAGNLIVPKPELEALLQVKAGDVFSRRAIANTTNKISGRLAVDGYAFANVNAVPDVNEEKRSIALTFYVEPGSRVYVRRINITGNTKTRDGIVRREIRQMEGGWLSTPLVERSKIRLQKLGYFGSVNVETLAVAGTTDQVDLNFGVEEGSTGNFTAGLGYGDTQGLLLNMSVTLNNFLGTGKRVSTQINNSRVNTIYRFSYTNPYYTPDGISRGFSLSSRSTNAARANLAAYSTNRNNATVTYGFPLTEYSRASLSLGFENTRLRIRSDTAPPTYQTWVEKNGNNFNAFITSMSWSHDTRNRAIFPDRGAYTLLSARVATPGGDLEYYKLGVRQRWYKAITDTVTFSLAGELGYGDSYGGTSALPFYEHYYAGGSRSVRGFRGNTLGPRDDLNTRRAIGGASKVIGRMELFFPSPFAEEETRTFRLSTFIDVGNVFGASEKVDLNGLRSAYGLSAVWITGVGALTFNWAWPLRSKPEDTTEFFQFSIGAPF